MSRTQESEELRTHLPALSFSLDPELVRKLITRPAYRLREDAPVPGMKFELTLVQPALVNRRDRPGDFRQQGAKFDLARVSVTQTLKPIELCAALAPAGVIFARTETARGQVAPVGLETTFSLCASVRLGEFGRLRGTLNYELWNGFSTTDPEPNPDTAQRPESDDLVQRRSISYRLTLENIANTGTYLFWNVQKRLVFDEGADQESLRYSAQTFGVGSAL